MVHERVQRVHALDDRLVRDLAGAFSGWEVSRQRVGNAFGVRYRESIKEFCIELPYFGGTVQSRQRS